MTHSFGLGFLCVLYGVHEDLCRIRIVLAVGGMAPRNTRGGGGGEGWGNI